MHAHSRSLTLLCKSILNVDAKWTGIYRSCKLVSLASWLLLRLAVKLYWYIIGWEEAEQQNQDDFKHRDNSLFSLNDCDGILDKY